MFLITPVSPFKIKAPSSSHACLPAKASNGPRGATAAAWVHRGNLHNVNKPICTNCCTNSQTPSHRWPVKARSVPSSVGVSVSNTSSNDFHRYFIEPPSQKNGDNAAAGVLRTIASEFSQIGHIPSDHRRPGGFKANLSFTQIKYV